jgi:hypothetical protein
MLFPSEPSFLTNDPSHEAVAPKVDTRVDIAGRVIFLLVSDLLVEPGNDL